MTQSNVNVNLHPSKGTLLVGDGTGTLAELSVGANDTLLTADSGEATGLKWAAASGGGAWTFISGATASSSSDITFTSGIDSTYNVYWFEFLDIFPGTSNQHFHWRSSTDGGASYDDGSTDYFESADAAFGYVNNNALTVSSSNALMINSYLYNPSGTVVYPYMSNLGSYFYSGGQLGTSECWRRNSTADIDAMKFFFASGNIASGTIRMYGLKIS